MGLLTRRSEHRRPSGLTREEADLAGYALTIAISEGWIEDDGITQAQNLVTKLNNEMEKS